MEEKSKPAKLKKHVDALATAQGMMVCELSSDLPVTIDLCCLPSRVLARHAL